MRPSSWIAGLTGTMLLCASVPADAQVVRFDPSLTAASSMSLTDVQFRGGHGPRRLPGGGFGGRRFGGGHFGNRGFGHRGYAYRGGGFGRGRGAAIGAGVAGLAAGALIGGALASQPAYGYDYAPGYGYAPPPPVPVGDASAYCAQRFKSYDPASGTYLGYDGQRHPCP